jgi:trehalose-phosphatase
MATPEPVPPALRAALARLAGTPRLLVASDYDGVLAPIVTDPSRAYPLPAGIAALGRLAALPATTVALVSGRSRVDLAGLARRPGPVALPAEVLLVGSHGSELGRDARLDPDQAALRDRVAAALGEIVQDRPGVWLETKPVSLVVHTRPARPEVGASARGAVLAGPGRWPRVQVTTGKEVVELSVATADKGTALQAMRSQSAASAVLYLGDDQTDENAFAVLREAGGDVGVKVGPGDTRARFRVPDPPAAVRVLELLQSARAQSVDHGLPPACRRCVPPETP